MAELRGAVAAVCQGKNGRLFLGTQDGFSLDHFVGNNQFNDTMLRRWRQTLARRGRECARRGIPYVCFIVPDAPSVCPQDLPDALQAGFRPPGEVFLAAMGDIPDVHFIYPLAELRQAEGGLEVYKKKDSHWTSYGSFLAYRVFMRHVAGLAPGAMLPARQVRFGFRRSYGDLGCQMDPEQAEDIPVPDIAGPGVSHVSNLEGAFRQTATETLAQDESLRGRALFFRDSYMTDLSPYLARSFAAVLTIGSTTRVMLDVVDSWKPDIVVSQVAERKLFFHEPDHQLDGYATIYGNDVRSPLGARLLKAGIECAADPAGARAAILDVAGQLRGNAMHAFSAALIMEAAGDIARAKWLIDGALAEAGAQPSFLALAGRIALAEGDMKRAADLTGRAVEQAPYNGYFHELHSYSLVQAGDLPAALRALEGALARVEDHANLWYWASVCYKASAQPGKALHCIEQALLLAPGQEAYEAHLAKLKRQLH